MTWITFLWPMVTAACITMGLMQVRIGLRRKPGAAHLWFAVTAFSFAAFSGLELAMMLAHSPARFLELQPWSDFFGAAGAVSLAAFVWVFFATGRKWVALLGSVLVCGPLILNVSPEPKLIFLQVTGIRTVRTFGGANYAVAEGTRNPWVAVYYLGVFLIAVFVADASVMLWRRGGRRRAVLVGGTITGFILIAGVQAWLVDAGILATPYLVSLFYLIILVAMGTELSDEVLQASQLARDLSETQKRLNLAADATKLGLWVWDVENDAIWTTPRGRALFGFTPTERIDRKRLLNAVHPDDREAVRTAQRDSLLTDVDYEREYRVMLPEGGTRWVDVRGRVERDEAGRAVRVLGAAFDITGRRQSEQKIVQQRDELAHVTRVSTMAYLAAALAHELSQPLGAILRNAEAGELILRDPSPDLVEVDAILTDIRNDSRRAGEVIDRMRGMMKRREAELRPLDPALLAGEVVALVGPDAALRRVCLALEADPGLPLIQGERVQLQQVLINLILNALDAVDGNPPATRLVRVRARLADASVELTVSDMGGGIPADTFSRLFEPFVSSKPGGLGLGLALSRSIVEAHGGRLWAENDPAGGATFTCTLPVAKGDGAE